MNMIGPQEVLALFDIKMGYGTDDYSQKVLQKMDKDEKGKHVTIRKNMNRYINGYIERKFKEENNNRPPLTDEDRNSIIRIKGARRSAIYEKQDILLMLEDKRIQELLYEQLEKNTILLKGHRVPKVVMDYYIAEENGAIEEIEQGEKQKKYYEEIKNDSTDTLNMKLFIIDRELTIREEFEKKIKDIEELEEIEREEFEKKIEAEEYDEVAGSRSPESLYYHDEE